MKLTIAIFTIFFLACTNQQSQQQQTQVIPTSRPMTAIAQSDAGVLPEESMRHLRALYSDAGKAGLFQKTQK